MKRLIRQTLLSVLILSGVSACQPHAVPVPQREHISVTEPDTRLPDYLTTACQNVWPAETAAAVNNPLYWQRAIDCSERFSAAEARAEARRWPVQSWARAFKQGILLANGNVTPVERRQYIATLDSYSADFPATVRPLIQLWRSNQAAQLELSEARSRYSALQQSHDSELDALRHQQARLHQALNETQRKLERLTDIERQLSSRKAPDSSDSPHAGDEIREEQP